MQLCFYYTEKAEQFEVTSKHPWALHSKGTWVIVPMELPPPQPPSGGLLWPPARAETQSFNESSADGFQCSARPWPKPCSCWGGQPGPELSDLWKELQAYSFL